MSDFIPYYMSSDIISKIKYGFPTISAEPAIQLSRYDFIWISNILQNEVHRTTAVADSGDSLKDLQSRFRIDTLNRIIDNIDKIIEKTEKANIQLHVA
jgi:hypothetical protein